MTAHLEKYLNLLLFSVRGVHFGIDAEQALETAAYDGEGADDLLWFHEELEFAMTSAVYAAPTIITVGTRGGRQYRVIIDAMEDIAEYSWQDIRPFPAIMEPFTMRNGIWGILPRNGRMTLLVDFIRLFNGKPRRHRI